jgi:ComF family protein
VSTFRLAADAVLAALLAPPCAACGCVIDSPLDGAVCATCWQALDRGDAAVGPGPAPITELAAIGEYEGPLRSIVHAWKYEGRRSLARPLARRLAVRGAAVLAGADAVVPVPLHPRRERERGFNQAADLARELNLPVLHPLSRVVHTQPQVDLPASARHDNVRRAFAVVQGGRWRERLFGWRSRQASMEGAVLVLVDDVTTTGATLQACARVLRQAGAREVRALTAARVATGRG